MRTFGKYRLLELLASGGMADVWRAEVVLAQGVVKEVALKLVRGEHQDEDEFVRMFVEEARLACRLSHANVVQVFEFAEVGGRYYLAMELVRGRHLGQVVERAREQGVRLGLPRAVHIVAEAARALAYVHRQADAGRPLGLVHRDVSPHNLLVSLEGEVKLADFGIARAMSLVGVTEPGTLKGKLAYMAPEQAAGGPVDARADLFSLGVVLWELCAGRRLFARESEAATMAAVLSGPPPSAPSAWNEAVPPELDAVVLRALERNPAQRTPSAEEFATALSGLLLKVAHAPQDWDLRALMQRLWPEGERSAAGGNVERTLVRPDPGAGAVASEAPPPEGDTAATRTLVQPARARRRVLAIAAAAIALAAGGTFAGLRWLRAAPAGARAKAQPVDARGSKSTPEVAPTARSATGEATSAAGAEAAPGGAPSPVAAISGSAPSQEGTAPSGEEPAPPGDEPAASDDALAGQGELYVNVTPWARVTVDGHAIGETPVRLRVSAGAHSVRVDHPRFGARERILEVRPGRRASWTPTFGR